MPLFIVRRSRIVATILFAFALPGVMTACSLESGATAARATQATATRAEQATQVAQATRTAEPIWTDISVTQEGMLATDNARLQIAVTITNRTSASIHVSYTCGYAPVIMQVIPVNGQGLLWTQETYSCPLQPSRDDQEITPGAAYTYRYTAELSSYAAHLGNGDFHPGDYRVTATYSWHQGTLNQLGTVSTLLYGKATGETTTTLR